MFRVRFHTNISKGLSAGVLAIAAALIAGCGGVPVKEHRNAYDEDASWALKIASQTGLVMGHSIVKDVESFGELTVKGESAGYGIPTAALIGGVLSNPVSTPGSVPALDALVMLGMMGQAGKTADAQMYAPTTLAWFPADQATSAADARDKFHSMRVKAIQNHLDENGVKYTTKNTHLPAMLVGPLTRITHIIPEHFDIESCPECWFIVQTAIPTKNTVMSPKELLGYSYPAYKFRAASSSPGDRQTATLSVVLRKTEEGYEMPQKHRGSRDFDVLTWFNKIATPEWAVEYIPYFKPERLLAYEQGKFPTENPYPFMVHKGEIKHFIKGQ